jgi:ribA/ribD-fused uncharacterized protein
MVMVATQTMTCFFEASNPLSNWHPAPFMYRGIEFGNTEQFMMYCKAKLFNDHETAEKILRAKTPKEHKALGRQVRNFDESLWNEKCEGYVRIGCLEKFRQNPSLAKVLLDTGSSELVEASPYDKIWGVGLAANDPRIHDKAQWRGQNRLGKVLTQVRGALAQEMAPKSALPSMCQQADKAANVLVNPTSAEEAERWLDGPTYAHEDQQVKKPKGASLGM